MERSGISPTQSIITRIDWTYVRQQEAMFLRYSRLLLRHSLVVELFLLVQHLESRHSGSLPCQTVHQLLDNRPSASPQHQHQFPALASRRSVKLLHRRLRSGKLQTWANSQ